jgi:hypothetical protein
MKKQALWAILGAMLGAGGAVAIKPVFDSEATIKPRFEVERIATFPVACPPVTPVEIPAVTHLENRYASDAAFDTDDANGHFEYLETVTVIDAPARTDYGPDAGPCKGIEIGAAIYATNDPGARAIAIGAASGSAVEPPQDAGGLGPLARIEAKAKQAIRAARSTPDAGGKVKGLVNRVVIFPCESCSTVDGGTPYGIEACDDEGCVSVPLGVLPNEVINYAEDFWQAKTMPDASGGLDAAPGLDATGPVVP